MEVLATVGGCRARLGRVQLSDRDDAIETPCCFVHTRTGAVPHLTRDVLDKAVPFAWDAMMPLRGLVDRPGAAGLASLGATLRDFAALPPRCRAVCMTLADCESQPPDGGNTEREVSVYSSSGRSRVDAASFAALDAAAAPDFAVAPADVQSAHAGRKRQRKAVERTAAFLDAVREAGFWSPETRLLGAVVGGGDLEMRAKSAELVAAAPVAGCFIEGLSHGLSAVDRRAVLDAVIPLLPDGRPRGVRCAGHPVEVLELVASGVDMVDTSFAFAAAERGEALTFEFAPSAAARGGGSDAEGGAGGGAGGGVEGGGGSGGAAAGEADELVGSVGVDPMGRRLSVNLWDSTHASDFTPLGHGSRYTRAYMHHLLTTHEMLAPVALASHNLRCYLEFFQDVRESLRKGDFDERRREFVERHTAVPRPPE